MLTLIDYIRKVSKNSTFKVSTNTSIYIHICNYPICMNTQEKKISMCMTVSFPLVVSNFESALKFSNWLETFYSILSLNAFVSLFLHDLYILLIEMLKCLFIYSFQRNRSLLWIFFFERIVSELANLSVCLFSSYILHSLSLLFITLHSFYLPTLPPGYFLFLALETFSTSGL